MSKNSRLLWICGFFGVLASANAQTPPTSTAASTFDGTYRLVSTSSINATYTDRNGRTAPCPNRRPGPLHIEHGQARYTNATGYKLRGTVGPQGELAMRSASEPAKYGGMTIERAITGKIDGDGMVRARLITNQCNYDLIWRKVSK